MIQEDFANLHNHTSEALTAAWKLLWSLVIGALHGFCIAAIWMRNLVEDEAPPAWVQLAFYEPVKLKYELEPIKAPWEASDLTWSADTMGMLELQNENIMSDKENYA
jgi:hypothetical protein